EGAALAQAILETLADRGTLVVATTHLEPLRAFASSEPRARNASVEFDTATLAPTFRLRYDVPGQSYALAIAGRLGLSPDLIARAQGHRSADAARVSHLIARLDEASRTEAERTLVMERRGEGAARRRRVWPRPRRPRPPPPPGPASSSSAPRLRPRHS